MFITAQTLARRAPPCAFLLLAAAACDPPTAATSASELAGPRAAWHDLDAPSLLDDDLEYRLDALPSSGAAATPPWPGSYWPTYRDSINDRWAGANTRSPAAKYGLAFAEPAAENGVSRRFGVDSLTWSAECTSDADCSDPPGSVCARRRGAAKGRCSETWFGICDAWSAAAILEPEPRHSVTHNGVEFRVNDIKALLSLTYTAGVEVRHVSLRCDQRGDEADLDGVRACDDTNPGTFHVVVANLLGLRGQAFVEDRTYDYEVWNQPIRSFVVLEHTTLTAAEADALLGAHGERLRTRHRAGDLAESEWRDLGSVPAAAGERLRVRMTGTGDADLYVRWDSPASEQKFDCRPFLSGSHETCELVAPPGATRAHVGVLGYVDSTFSVDIDVFAAPPATYAFNPEAAELRRLRTELRWVTESPSELDGPLSGQISQFTIRETHDYVLELDADGAILGGEWLGDSRTDHPDFLWLPIRRPDGVVADAIATADVDLLAAAAAAP